MCLPRSMRGIRLAAKSMPKKMQLKELNKPKSMQFQQLTAYRQAADSLAKAERCLAHARRALSTRAAAIHATARRCIAKARRALSTRAAALSEPEQLRSEKRQATQFKELNELQRRRQHAERRKIQPRAMPAFGTDQIHSPMHKGLRCVRATKVFCRVSLVSRERTRCLRISWPSIRPRGSAAVAVHYNDMQEAARNHPSKLSRLPALLQRHWGASAARPLPLPLAAA